MIESSDGGNRQPRIVRQPRIALVTTELAVGGAEQCLTRIALGLARRGYQPAVYSLLPPPAAPRDRLVRQLAEAEIPLHFLELRRATQFPRGVRLLTELLERQQPSLIQSFLFHANILTTFAVRRLRRRIRVASVDGAEPLAAADSTAASPPTLGVKHVCGWRVADQRPCRAWLEARLTRNVDHLVCVSQSVANQAKRLGVPPTRISVIPNGVDTSLFAYEPTPARRNEPATEPGELATTTSEPAVAAVEPTVEPAVQRPRLAKVEERRPTLLAVGRLDPQKGFDWLLQDARRLLDALPQFRLEIVGEGPERPVLAERIAAAGLQGRIELVGWQNDIPCRLRTATLVLIPSRWEGMPNVLLEAMASGRAVVATRVEGVEELLGPEMAAQSTEVLNLRGFIDRAIELARDPITRDRLGAVNAQRVREQFSIDAMVDAYVALYQRLAP